ncbi:hypothetical protein [Flavobacterium johnsoniae]|uniref:YobI family P-loop NTPase n=1 Tax=Flavobacterium johnsoniae TaxID=986 RepID=UPI003D97CF3F
MINQDENQNQNNEDPIPLEIENDNQSVEMELEILSPLNKKDDARVKKYLRHLKSAIDNKEIKNLALSGVYGSGKSTIIKSFKSQYANLEFLNISLASFNETNDYTTFKDQIQLNILQQIIYSQKAEKLPESRISRISELNVWDYKNWIKVGAFLLLIISTFLLLNFYSYQLNPNNWKLADNFNWSCFILIIISLASMSVIGQIFIELLKNLRINKISLKDAEFGNKTENKDLLNKHIDEILYFFEKISIDIVVIEDLDRFNTTEIYRTLREINFILNSYLYNIKPHDPRKVTFLYAIKDDLFLNELDRTKFFDLIIPAIPFVNYSNSKSVLNEKLDKIFIGENIFNKPTKEFINTVSSFITDNRTLINIINEFIIYKEQQKLEKEELNPEKLLALIIYKNLRPKDFSRLHLTKSNIDLIFYNKEELIKDYNTNLNDKIDLIQEEIKGISNGNIKKISDLNTIYLYYIKGYITELYCRGLMYDSKRQTFETIINKGFDLNQFYESEIRYYNNSNVDHPLNIKLIDIDKIIGYSYAEKYDLIVNQDKRILEKEDEIKKNRGKQNDLNNWTLKEILENKDLSKENLKKELDKFYKEISIEEKDKIYNDPLLIFLLLNGYIDEHYKEYISIFQKGGINKTDQEFKINIISRISEPKSFDYELSNLDDIIEELPLNNFKNDRILNVDLVNHITAFKSIYQDKFQAVLNTISNWNSRRIWSFLSYFIYEGNERKEFIIELAKSWDKFWHTIKEAPNFIEQDKKQILFILLSVADDATLLFINKNKELSSYIANDIMILYELNEQNSLDRIKNILSEKVLDVKFKELLPFNDGDSKLFDVIYKNNRYEITYNNLGTLIEHKLDIEFNLDRFNKSNLTYIRDSNFVEIVKFLELDNYKTYINEVYLQLENNQDEDILYVLEVLNNEILETEIKKTFIQKQINKISHINDLRFVNDFDLVIEENKVALTWENVYHYYYQYDNSFNEIINAFLNESENYLILALATIKINIDKDLQNEFILKLIGNDNLTIESYSTLLESVPKQYRFTEKFDYNLVSKDKVEKLIQFNIIPLTVYHYREIKSIYPESHVKLLLRNWKDYLDFYKKYEKEIGIDDIILLLQNSNLREGLKHYIIKNQILDNDLLNERLAVVVSKLLINSKNKIKDIDSLLNLNRLTNIFTNALEGNIKVRLINLIGDKLTKVEIVILKDLMEKPFINIHPKSQLLLPDNKINWDFIKILKSKGIAGEAKANSKKEIRVWLLDYR